MGNYTNKTIKVTQLVDMVNPKKHIARLISNLDSDFHDVSEELAERIVSKNKTVKGMIDDIKKLSFPSDLGLSEDLDESEFILNNRSYCRSFTVSTECIHDYKVKLVFTLSI